MSTVIDNTATTAGSPSSLSTIPPSSSSSSAAFRPGGFLDQCFLCRAKLSPGKDIYMYRGDRAFCSEECRCRQILLDEQGTENRHSVGGGRTSKNRSRSRNGAPGGV